MSMSDLIGRSLGRYRIVELLGAGGMGEVYRAHDTKLRRDVAIKVLSNDITEDRGHLERFEREARALAQLSHSNILAIHDLCADDGVTFAVEELLEGRDLRRELAHGRMAKDRVIEVISAVAEGLGAAHRKGILHRDIKPENIFALRDGGVKILDFGLARSFERVDHEARTQTEASDLTAPGAIVGTISYVSPEQARSETLTPRSDVFSLGCVFYELLTGVHPFRKHSGVETMVAILNESPARPSAIDPSISPALDGIIARCLEKSPDERFESARDIAFAINALSGPQPVPSGVWGTLEAKPEPRLRRSWIAVAITIAIVVSAGAILGVREWAHQSLPEIKQISVARFEPVGDDPEMAALAAGLSEVVADGLAVVADRSPGIAWVEALRLSKRRTPDRLAAGNRDFNITLGIIGRVEDRGDRVRLVLDVIDPSSGLRLRRTAVEDQLGNPYAFQVSPVAQLVDELGLELDSETLNLVRAASTDVPPALNAYLHGLGGLALATTADEAQIALGLLETAAESDPIFVGAKIAVARACRTIFRQTESALWLERGVSQMEQVASADAPPVQSLLVLAGLRRSGGDRDGERAAFERAVELDPNSGEARRRFAAGLARAGEAEEAERQYQRATFLQPGYWPNHHYMAELYSAQGRFEAAANEYRRVVQLAPLYVGGYSNLAVTYVRLGRLDLARDTFEESLLVDSTDNYAAFSNLGTLYYEERRFADAAAMFERALAINDGDYRVWGNLAATRSFGEGSEPAEAPFRRALELAEVERQANPADAYVLCDIAGYHASLGERDLGFEAVESAAAAELTDPLLMVSIAETFEDLDDRERALEWVGRAFTAGVSPSEFGDNPTLRDLVADERYRSLTDSAAHGNPTER